MSNTFGMSGSGAQPRLPLARSGGRLDRKSRLAQAARKGPLYEPGRVTGTQLSPEPVITGTPVTGTPGS